MAELNVEDLYVFEGPETEILGNLDQISTILEKDGLELDLEDPVPGIFLKPQSELERFRREIRNYPGLCVPVLRTILKAYEKELQRGDEPIVAEGSYFPDYRSRQNWSYDGIIIGSAPVSLHTTSYRPAFSEVGIHVDVNIPYGLVTKIQQFSRQGGSSYNPEALKACLLIYTNIFKALSVHPSLVVFPESRYLMEIKNRIPLIASRL